MGGSVAPWRDPTMWGKRGGGGGIAVARRGGWRVRGSGGGIAVARRGGDKKKGRHAGVFLPGASGWA